MRLKVTSWHEATLVMSSVLLCEPKLMVVDELMVGLDLKGMRLLKGILRQEAHDKGPGNFTEHAISLDVKRKRYH